MTTFLTANKELSDYSNNGFTSKFTGELRSIPDDLQSELSQSFPAYKFYIARMTVLIDAPFKKYDLILIIDIVSAEVKGFVWGNYWTLHPSKSFPSLLKGHQTKSEDDAVSQIKTFARLIAFTSNDKIGDAKIQKGKVKVKFIKGKGVFSILEVGISSNLLFDRMAITKPNGKKLKYFVWETSFE